PQRGNARHESLGASPPPLVGHHSSMAPIFYPGRPTLACMPAEELLDWLLDSDPALRWQVERDLVRAPAETWRATRARVATAGFGARLLALQDPDGQWAAGAFFPGDFDFAGPEAEEDAGQPWTATT